MIHLIWSKDEGSEEGKGIKQALFEAFEDLYLTSDPSLSKAEKVKEIVKNLFRFAFYFSWLILQGRLNESLHLLFFVLALLCFALLCFALLCFALLCFALLCFALLCFLDLFKQSSGQCHPCWANFPWWIDVQHDVKRLHKPRYLAGTLGLLWFLSFLSLFFDFFLSVFHLPIRTMALKFINNDRCQKWGFRKRKKGFDYSPRNGSKSKP